MKVCILLGPPGAGKGTQAALLANRLGALHISTGAIIRSEISSGSELGKSVKSVVESGKLVSDDLLFQCLGSTLHKTPQDASLLILDGVPRNLAQVDTLESTLRARGLKTDLAIAVTAPVQLLVERFSKRWTCGSCSSVASFESSEMAAQGKCPSCGKVGMFARRKDDEPETVRTRFSVYDAETAPIVEVFEKRGLLSNVDALQPVEKVYVDIVCRLFGSR